MITVYYKLDNTEMTIFNNKENDVSDKIVRKCWIHLFNPTLEEVKLVSDKTGIPETVINTPLDEEERAHVDIDDGITLIVVDTPLVEYVEDDINKYSTLPFGIIFNQDYLITTCLKANTIEMGLTNRGMKNFSTNKHAKLAIQILYRNATNFVYHLKMLDKISQEVEKNLHKSTKNKELFQLMSLGKSLVYLSTGLNANKLVMEKLRRIAEFQKYEDDVDLLDDAIIENQQAMEMCSIHRDILNGTMDAFASVISNNVNLIMKTLTVVTIVLTIPTLVASVFGMNVWIPFEDKPIGFIIAIVISAVLAIISAIVLIRYTNRVGKK